MVVKWGNPPEFILFHSGYHRGNCVICDVPRHCHSSCDAWDCSSFRHVATRSMPRRSTTGPKWLLGWFFFDVLGQQKMVLRRFLIIHYLQSRLETWNLLARFGLGLSIFYPFSIGSIFYWLQHLSSCILFHIELQDLCKLRIVPWLP